MLRLGPINCISLNVPKKIKDELRNVISGKSKVRYGRIIQTIARYLEDSTGSSKETRGTKQFKEQEAKALTHCKSFKAMTFNRHRVKASMRIVNDVFTIIIIGQPTFSCKPHHCLRL